MCTAAKRVRMCYTHAFGVYAARKCTRCHCALLVWQKRRVFVCYATAETHNTQQHIDTHLHKTCGDDWRIAEGWGWVVGIGSAKREVDDTVTQRKPVKRVEQRVLHMCRCAV